MTGVGQSRLAALAALGLGADATRGQIVHAYRRLARDAHPDRSADPAAAERFDLLTAAYHRALRAEADSEQVIETSPTPPPLDQSPLFTGPPGAQAPQTRRSADAVHNHPPLQRVVWLGRRVLFAAGPAHVEPLAGASRPAKPAVGREDAGGPEA